MSKRSDKKASKQAEKLAKQHARQVKQDIHPSGGKVVRHGISDWSKHPIRFVFSIFDDQFQWGCSGGQSYCVSTLCSRLKDLENTTWGELQRQRSKNHAMPVDQLCVEARKRLVEIKQEDTDTLWELHISNVHRVFGIKECDSLKVLWWDPEHNVYPMDIKGNSGGKPRAVCGVRKQSAT